MKILAITALFSGATFAFTQAPVTQIDNSTRSQRLNRSLSIFYGSEGVGGGHIVSCQGQPSVTLDYYNALVKAQHKNLLKEPEDDNFEKKPNKKTQWLSIRS